MAEQTAAYLPANGLERDLPRGDNAAPGYELIVADLLLPADAVGEAHYHPWEEYLYVIDGSAVLDIDGMEPRTLQAGEHFVIARETVHTPRAGPDGVRAIIARVHKQGDPVMVPAPRPNWNKSRRRYRHRPAPRRCRAGRDRAAFPHPARHHRQGRRDAR